MKLKVDQKSIYQILPYGQRFIFLKDVLSVQSSPARLEASQNPEIGGGMDADHFRSFRVYPGIFILEGCAQAAVCLYQHAVRKLETDEVPLLAHSRVRFKSSIKDAVGLIHAVELVKSISGAAIFNGQSRKGQQLVMECELGLAVRRSGDIAEPRNRKNSVSDAFLFTKSV